MQPTLPAPSGSILDLVARALAVGSPAAFAIRPTVRVGSATLIPVAIDNGNDALKSATLRAEPVIAEGAEASASESAPKRNTGHPPRRLPSRLCRLRLHWRLVSPYLSFCLLYEPTLEFATIVSSDTLR
jgi:hypothetical protein